MKTRDDHFNRSVALRFDHIRGFGAGCSCAKFHRAGRESATTASATVREQIRQWIVRKKIEFWNKFGLEGFLGRHPYDRELSLLKTPNACDSRAFENSLGLRRLAARSSVARPMPTGTPSPLLRAHVKLTRADVAAVLRHRAEQAVVI